MNQDLSAPAGVRRADSARPVFVGRAAGRRRKLRAAAVVCITTCATFFVVGDRALEHPGLVRQEWRDGHDIGVHTYTHADLETAPAWRRRAELALSQVALEAAIGRRSSLIRMPYSSTVSAVTSSSL